MAKSIVAYHRGRVAAKRKSKGKRPSAASRIKGLTYQLKDTRLSLIHDQSNKVVGTWEIVPSEAPDFANLFNRSGLKDIDWTQDEQGIQEQIPTILKALEEIKKKIIEQRAEGSDEYTYMFGQKPLSRVPTGKVYKSKQKGTSKGRSKVVKVNEENVRQVLEGMEKGELIKVRAKHSRAGESDYRVEKHGDDKFMMYREHTGQPKRSPYKPLDMVVEILVGDGSALRTVSDLYKWVAENGSDMKGWGKSVLRKMVSDGVMKDTKYNREEIFVLVDKAIQEGLDQRRSWEEIVEACQAATKRHVFSKWVNERRWNVG